MSTTRTALITLLVGLAVLAVVAGLPLPLGAAPSARLAATRPATAMADPTPAALQPAERSTQVVEQLRLRVPAGQRQAWLVAERGSWGPFLARQEGFLGRELLWDPAREEGTLLIRWASRAAWKAIPSADLQEVQLRFETLAREQTGLSDGNPFPLVFEGELVPL